MGFIREPINEHLSTETRRESFKIHASHEWQPKSAGGYPGAHIELPYEDLPGLIRDLIQIMHENCDMDKV